VGIIIGLKIIKKMIDKYKRPSIIVIILASILAASAIMVPYFNFFNILKQSKAGVNIYEFGNMCQQK